MTIATEHTESAAFDHVVQLYGSDDELIDSVGGYLLAAAQSAESAIVVATQPHRRALAEMLAHTGIDIRAAIASGSYLALDADKTMRRFLIDGWPYRQRFESVIGGLVRQASESGRPVRIFGEMVALLWERGQVNAAIQLERLWNELAGDIPFSLFCAYRADSVAGEEHVHARHEMCGLHSAVVGSGEIFATRTFSRSTHAPAEARRFVVETLQTSQSPALVFDAALVITELATNAVNHAQTEFTVTVTARRKTAYISVRDGIAAPPVPRAAPTSAGSGRGLGIVAALATQWGTTTLHTGKTVWVELRD